MSTEKKKVIGEGTLGHTEELNAAIAENKAKNEALAGNSIVDQVDISTIANEKPEAIAPPKKKTSGPKSYKTAYDLAGGAAELGDYAKWEKKAKDWNTKKYGSTNPTADAKKAGMSKSELASKHKVDSTKFTESLTIGGKKTAVSDLDPKYTTVGVMAPSPTNTSNNASIAKTTAAVNSSDSLLGGVKSRREMRQEKRQGNRQERYMTRLDNKEKFQQGLRDDKQDRQDNRSRRQGNRQEKQNQRQTGNKFVSSADAQAASSRTKAMITPTKKKSGGEFWGKSGAIK